MSKKLENYIDLNKKDFNLEEPSDQLWKRIEAKLDKKRNRTRLQSWLSIAALLAVLISVTFLYTYRNSKTKVHVTNLNQGYAQKEIKFASQIEAKKDSLQSYAKNNPVLYRQFSKDLNDLGADYESLKNQLQNSPNQRMVIRAMIKNMELQLQVINQQLLIINEVNQYKKENQI